MYNKENELEVRKMNIKKMEFNTGFGILSSDDVGIRFRDKFFAYSRINQVILTKKFFLMSGSIHFVIAGVESPSLKLGKPEEYLAKIFSHQNSVPYKKKQSKAMIQFKNIVEENIVNYSSKNSTNTFSAADEIKKFAELYKQGIISSEEFEKKKKELL
jgi:hypothetical protein